MKGVVIEVGRLRVRFEYNGKLREVIVPLTRSEMVAIARCLLEASEYCSEPGPPARVVDLRAEALRRAMEN